MNKFVINSMHSESSDSEDEDPFYKKYIRVQKVAQGTYGVVWKGRKAQTGEIVAIKKFKNMGNEGLPVSAVRQIHILKSLKSQYILQPIELNIKKKSVSMVCEWKQFSLYKMIKSPDQYSSKKVFKQILKAMDTIHSNFVMHRDIKPANIVLDNVESLNLKIIDFGMAKQIKWNKNASLTNAVGTLYYRAPQLLDGCTKYEKQIDIWALGCIFYELLTRQIMFKGENQALQLMLIYESVSTEEECQNFLTYHSGEIQKIERNEWQWISESVKTYCQGTKQIDLLKRLIAIDPKRRISCKEALNHEYFSEQ